MNYCLIFLMISGCFILNSYGIYPIQVYDGEWERSSNGNLDLKNIMVIGAIDPIDNETQYICRAKHRHATIPGKLVPSHKKCYIARRGKEHGYHTYEILVNRKGYRLKWKFDQQGNFPLGSVFGGYAGGWPMIVCRALHMGRENRWRYVSGKLDPEPGFACCYIPYHKKEHCYKEYEVLMVSVFDH